MTFPTFYKTRQSAAPPARGALFAVLAVGLFIGIPAFAQVTNVPAAAAPDANFGHYLVTNQKVLEPVFSKNGETLIKVLVPILLSIFGNIVVIALLAGWAINIFLGRCFTAFFAPVYTKLKFSIIYSSGEFLLSFLFVGLLAFLIIAFPAIVQSVAAFSFLVLLFIAVPFVVHVAWVRYSFRTDTSVSAFFYLGVLAVHAATLVLTMAPVVGAQAPSRLLNYVDQNVVPQLRAEVASSRKELTSAQQEMRDEEARMDAVNAQLAQDDADQITLQKQIEEQKNSEAYLFSRIAQVRAKGDEEGARAQLVDLMKKFPSGSMTDAIKAQMADIDASLAVEDAKKKKELADAAQAEAAARADLLARAAKGEVTLSEMRRALVGKKIVEIKQLFGLPTEVGSDRWGFGQKMIMDPLTEKKSGLAVYFSAGIVQSVDYYYGDAPQK